MLTAHVCCAMSAVLTRLLTLCLALAFLVGVTAQLVPSSMAQAQMTLSTEMADGCAGPQPPCSGHTPNCVEHIGCITVSALRKRLGEPWLIATVPGAGYRIDAGPDASDGKSEDG